MGLAHDGPLIDDKFGLIGLPFDADCCMILDILVIKSPSREMGNWSDAATAMTYLLGPTSLALAGNGSSHQCKERRLGNRTRGRVQRPAGQPRQDRQPRRDGSSHTSTLNVIVRLIIDMIIHKKTRKILSRNIFTSGK